MKNTNLTTHIIGGKYKGKKLELPSLDITRSSKARLKESFFNVLQFDIMDKIFIEAFAGSGSIGLEAVSRDAKRSYFIEIDKNSYRVLLKNCKNLNSNNTQTIFANTFNALPTLLQELKNSTNELVLYLDPPFDIRDGMEDVYEKCFSIIREIENKNIFLICFEHISILEMPEILGSFVQIKQKKFGKSTLSYYKYK